MTAVALALVRSGALGHGRLLRRARHAALSRCSIVLFWSQLVGLGGLARLDRRERARDGPAVACCSRLAAGIAGVVGLGCLYRGMAVGAMGIVAPISATSPIVPLAVDLAARDAPRSVQWVGIALALAGIVLVSREPGGIGTRTARPSRRVSGLRSSRRSASGCSSSASARRHRRARPGRSPTARFSSVTALVLALAGPAPFPACRGACCRSSLAVGVFDTGANALIALAATRGSIGIVAVLSSLYPITTILLARAVLHERLGTTRTAGGLIALGGAALIAAG